MKLLIINPSSASLYQDLSKDFSAKEPNIWAGLLANAVRDKHSVTIYDMEIERPSVYKFAHDVKSIAPDIILFVVTGQNPNASTAAMHGATLAAKSLRNHSVREQVAFVGPHVNALPYDTLKKHEDIDIVFCNEGVYALKNLLNTDLSDEALKSIKGIYWRNKEKEIIMNPPESVVPQEMLERDMPGVGYDLMPSLDKYRTSPWHANYTPAENRGPFASIYTSLGCIFKCDFCMINSINRDKNDTNNKKYSASDFNKFRYWSPEFTIKQLDYLAEQGVKHLKFADEMWVLKPKHFMTLCDLIIERNYDFNIWAYTRIDTIKPIYLEKLKQAGVNWLALGIESGNQNIRREITKGKFEDINIRNVVKMVQDIDINVVANYIVGLGHDTYDTMQDTLNLAFELNAENNNIYCATALPGSPLYNQSLVDGWELPTNYSEYGFLSYDHIPSRTHSLTAAEVLAFRDYAFHAMFDNPRFLSMIDNKFGEVAVKTIKDMTKIKLKRKLLGD